MYTESTGRAESFLDLFCLLVFKHKLCDSHPSFIAKTLNEKLLMDFRRLVNMEVEF